MTVPKIPDVDIDLKGRDSVLALFPTATTASQIERANLMPHKSGVYFQKIPRDPVTRQAAFPYEDAETLGYYKVDFLSNHVYTAVTSRAHLDEILAKPVEWLMFEHVEFVQTLFHFGGQIDEKTTMADIVAFYKPKSVMDLAVLIALKLPSKRHLIGEPMDKLVVAVWEKDAKKRVQFKKSHAVAYALCVIVDAQIKAPLFFT